MYRLGWIESILEIIKVEPISARWRLVGPIHCARNAALVGGTDVCDVRTWHSIARGGFHAQSFSCLAVALDYDCGLCSAASKCVANRMLTAAGS